MKIIFAFLAGLLTWIATIFGSSFVFFIKKLNKTFYALVVGISAGIMLAACYFSLLLPAISIEARENSYTWIVISLGFILGSITIILINVIVKVIEEKNDKLSSNNEFKKRILLIIAIALQNIPEGLAIGVAFGGIQDNIINSFLPCIMLTIGICVQNFPEGIVISLPLKNEGLSKSKAFFWGQISGIVEPIFAVIGAILVQRIDGFLPFILSFAAGALIYVVVQELIPSYHLEKKGFFGTIGLLVGFIIMLILELIV